MNLVGMCILRVYKCKYSPFSCVSLSALEGLEAEGAVSCDVRFRNYIFEHNFAIRHRRDVWLAPHWMHN